MVVSLVLFAPGTIRDIFAPWRSASIKKGLVKAYDPLALPQIEGQCIHVETQHLSEGIYQERCLNDAEPSGTHGWYCKEHYEAISSARPYKLLADDMAQAKFIIEQERKALDTCQREVVRIGRTTIEFVAGLNMTSNPEEYSREIKE